MNRFQELLLHVCVVCSFVYIIAKVIDWYNPYMDFSGRIYWSQVVMCVGVNLLCMMGTHKNLHRKKISKQKKKTA